MTTTPRPLHWRSQRALDAFLARLDELGATLLEPEWLGGGEPHQVRCSQGHHCTPRPADVARGTGICRTCGGNDPKMAEAAFLAKLGELGAILLEPRWLGSGTPHRVRCAEGHDCTPRPTDTRRGIGICRTCAGRDSGAAEAAFRARLAELDATLLEPQWLGNGAPHRVRCAAGHECAPRPTHVQQGQGICRTCAGKDTKVAEAAFLARLDELGATLLEPAWLGTLKPHRVRCAQGHESSPYPSDVKQTGNVCRTCSRRDPKAAESAFRARLDELGATLLEPHWLGADKPHRVRCSEGHECTPRPSGVQQGEGICRICAGKVWDVLYVVADEWGELVKVGITSGDPRPRLRNHRRQLGLDRVVRLHTGLPDGVARELEREVLAELEAAGVSPAWGRETFYGPRALKRMLALIDQHPAVVQASQGQLGQVLPS